MSRKIKITHHRWPTRGVFKISRSALTEIETVVVEIVKEGRIGRGECRPYSRYGETVGSVKTQIREYENNQSDYCREKLQTILPAGAARNAIDCALWDLEAKTKQQSVPSLIGLPHPKERITAFTLSVDTPKNMAKTAKTARDYPLLKLKIDGMQGLECVQAVLQARPDANIIVDANEAVDPHDLPLFQTTLAKTNVVLIEQPCHAVLPITINPDILGAPPVCADESLHGVQDLDKLWDLGYRAVNIKLDKSGGLTAAYKLIQTAKNKGFITMAGCMAASSLAMAPMQILEGLADFIDLDGPLLLENDVENGIVYDGANMKPAPKQLWGYCSD